MSPSQVFLLLFASSQLAFLVTGNIRGRGPFNLLNKQVGPRIMCGADTLMLYQDCRLCACPRPNRPAVCHRKTCDLRTKDTGMCPLVILKFDDAALCQGRPNNAGSCKTDNDCPGPQLCCFDFCDGPKCVNPVPLDMKFHPGRGYPA